jgi:uncharacterized membrane protein
MTANERILQLCRTLIAFVWFYQGLMPKLLGPHRDELMMNTALGLDTAGAIKLAYVGGSMEIGLAVLVWVFYRQTWPYWLTLAAMLGLLVFTVIFTPALLLAAFNPTTINLTVVALSVIALICLKEDKQLHGSKHGRE